MTLTLRDRLCYGYQVDEGQPMFTVRQLSKLAGVSVRTLHYYDSIGLFRPTTVGENGYRYYSETSLFHLQQILFYREVGLDLEQIKQILASPNFDLVTALRTHRQALQDRIEHLQGLIETVDRTVSHLAGEAMMRKQELFSGFNKEQQADYEREARLQYDPNIVSASIKLWNSYSEDKQQTIMLEGGQNYLDVAALMEAGKLPESFEVQDVLVRWHDHTRNFYEPTLEILRALGETYRTDVRFMAFFQKIHKDLPEFIGAAIAVYVDALETAEIEQLLAEDASNSHSAAQQAHTD